MGSPETGLVNKVENRSATYMRMTVIAGDWCI